MSNKILVDNSVAAEIFKRGTIARDFVEYLRTGYPGTLDILPENKRQRTGYVVSERMTQLIEQIINRQSPFRELSAVEKVSMESLNTIDEQQGQAPTKNSIDCHEMYTTPKTTQMSIDKARFDIEEWAADWAGNAFASLESAAFIYGNGSDHPKGILSYGDGIERVASECSDTVTAKDVMNLFFSLPEEYTNSATFIMNRPTLQSVRLLKESIANQYLWQPGLAADAPNTLLGIPIKTVADMPDMAVGDVPIALAAFQQAYTIADHPQIRILRDAFTDKPAVKFYTTKRVGGEVVNTKAIKLLQMRGCDG